MNINPFIDVMYAALDLVNAGLVVYIIMNVLLYFDIINKNNPLVVKIYVVLERLYEPSLIKIRKILPDNLPIDLSPVIAFAVIELIQGIMMTYLYH